LSYWQLSLPLANSSPLPPVGRRQTYQPFLLAGIRCAQETVTGPSGEVNRQSTLQLISRSEGLSV
jgi:hypothetical protein